MHMYMGVCILYYKGHNNILYMVPGCAKRFFKGFIMFAFAGFQIHHPSMQISVAVLVTCTIEYMSYLVI